MGVMRATVEIRDDQRAKLLEAAAQRGLKGFSVLVREAIDRYLDDLSDRAQRTADARAVLGTLDDEAATHLHESVRSVRATWR